LVPAEFFIHNLGCKLNRVEADALGDALVAAGGLAVTRDKASLIIITTCTVTAEAEAKTRKAIRRALACARRPWVVATGCAIALDREAYQALGARVKAEPDRTQALAQALSLLGLDEPSQTQPQASKSQPQPSQTQSQTSQTQPKPQTSFSKREGLRTRRAIKIQDGCDNSCSYCVVRVVRGASRSLPFAEITQRTQAAEAAGIRELVLTGVNIGSYRDQGRGLHELVEELLSGTTALRLRLSSLELPTVTDELLSLMAASHGRLCAHLHLPLQSGCDRTLEDMGRLYRTALYEERVRRARQLMPHLALGTDLMVGFPGESEEDFAQSHAFCERMRFSYLHVFRYSRRPQTSAASRTDQVPPALSARRAAALRELGAQMHHEDANSRVGTRELVLVERAGHATSESYHRVALDPACKSAVAIGSLVSVQFVAYRDNLLQAKD
jgi:threonylcarbamoyladenosine tRNA methylthiotransferase MtaB